MRYVKKAVLLVVFSINLFAHPHFFIDAKLEIKKDSLIHTWIFDRINSRLLIFEFDKNKDKVFDKDEQDNFLQTHFNKLLDDNYNIFLDIDGNEIKISPKDIKVSIEKRRVVLEFSIYEVLKKDSTLCTIDPTLYMAFNLIESKSILKIDTQKSKHDYCIGVLE